MGQRHALDPFAHLGDFGGLRFEELESCRNLRKEAACLDTRSVQASSENGRK